MNIIFGAGGFAREVETVMEACSNSSGHDIRATAFVTSNDDENIGKYLHGIEVIPETYFFEHCIDLDINAYIAVGSPNAKSRIHDKCIKHLKSVSFPKLIHPSVVMDNRDSNVKLGHGIIICGQCILTTDITVGSFVHLNLNTTVGHDVIIGDYTTVSPGVNISGRVCIADKCFIGTGATILERIGITNGTIVGGGATVVKDIDTSGTYVGTPAQLLRQ